MEEKKRFDHTVWQFVITIVLVCIFCLWIVSAKSKDTGIIGETVDPVLRKIHIYSGRDSSTVCDKEQYKGVLSDFSQLIGAGTEVRITIGFKCDIFSDEQYTVLHNELRDASTMEEVHLARRRLNTFSKSYHEEVVARNLHLVKDISCSSVLPVPYSPFVVLKAAIGSLDPEVLLELAENDVISDICIGLEGKVVENDSSWYDVLNATNSFSVCNAGLLTGYDVWIGVLETGLCDPDHANLTDKNLLLYNDSGSEYSDHATTVVSIISLMAPDADYYVCKVEDTTGLSLFLDDAVDVVNCSIGRVFSYNYNGNTVYLPHEYRIDYDGIYDYQIDVHDISVVVAAGNYDAVSNSQRRVCTPALAYNAITVGGLKEYSDAWYYSDYASYYSAEPLVKPEISAPCHFAIPYFGCMGTSFSAPQVTACIALLMQNDPYFCGSTEKVKAELIAHADTTADYYAEIGAFDTFVGAGCVDLSGTMSDNVEIIYLVPSSSVSGTSFVVGYPLSLASGDHINASLAWKAHKASENTTDGILLTDFDLQLLDSDNNVVASSALRSSNCEFIRFSVPVSDDYRLRVVLYGEYQGGSIAEVLSIVYNVQ